MFQLRLETALSNEAEILQNFIIYWYVNRCDYNFIYLLSIFVLMVISLKKEKEEIMRGRYKLNDTAYSVREDFSKQTVKICHRISHGIRLRSCVIVEKYLGINYNKIVTRNFLPRR